MELLIQEQQENDKIEKLFKLVFHNIVILRMILRFARLFEKNKFKSFLSRKELLEYKEKEYISKLSFYGFDMLEKGDLPINGVLEEINSNHHSLIKGNAIPYGVKRISFYSIEGSVTETRLSTLPSSIDTLIGISILNKTGQNDHHSSDDINSFYKIPSNIKTIKFNMCPNISNVNKGSGFIVIPNSIETLIFNPTWNNQDVELRKGDIPSSVTNLFVKGLVTSNINDGVLPSSIKDLTISCEDNNHLKDKGPFDHLPINLETLVLHSKVSIISQTLKLNSFISITKLSINFDYMLNSMEIKPSSLPPNLKDLSFIGFDGYIERDVIPKSVSYLNLSFSFRSKDDGFIENGAIPNSVVAMSLNLIVSKKDILPQSLNILSMQGNFRNFTDPNVAVVLDEMISILPVTLTSITLSKEFEKHKKVFPTSIKVSYN